MARLFALVVDPAVNSILGMIGGTITAAADQSPVIMGFLLGGIMLIAGIVHGAVYLRDKRFLEDECPGDRPGHHPGGHGRRVFVRGL